MENYKENIAQTRKGCLGSSDGSMLAQISSLGYVPKSAHKRLAVVKGLIEQEEIPSSPAMRFGDFIEMYLYNSLKTKDERYESNPLWVSQKYSQENCKLISHPDIVLQDNEKQTLHVYEVKATKQTFEQTRQHYAPQLCVHTLLAKEKASELGRGWKVKVYLVHYDTNGLDLSNDVEFDDARLTIKQVRVSNVSYDIKKAMEIVNAFLATFDAYYEGDVVDAELLPIEIKTQMQHIAMKLDEIKEREASVSEFKERLYAFMVAHDVKSIKNDYFAINAVEASESKTFDYKKYLDDMGKEHPIKTKRLMRKYTKTTKRKGYCTIKTFEK